MLFDPTKIKLNESNSDLSLQDMPSAPSPKEENNSNPSKRIIPEPRSSSSPPIQTVPPATAVAKITPAKISSPKYSNNFDDEDASFGLGKGILPNICDDMPVLKQRSFRCDPPTKSTASEAVFEDKKPSAQDIIPPETGTVGEFHIIFLSYKLSNLKLTEPGIIL